MSDNDQADMVSAQTMEKFEESFRRSVLKLAAAGKGVHEKLDAKLEEVRQGVRDRDSVDDIATKIESVTQVLMDVEEDRKLQTDIYTTQDVIEALVSCTRQKDIKRQLQALGNDKDLTGESTFRQIARVYLGEPEKSGLLDWFGGAKKDSKPNTQPQKPIESVQSQLIQLLNIVVADKAVSEFQQTKNSIEHIESCDDIAHALTEVAELALQVKNGERLKLSAFVQQLGQRLDQFDALLNDTESSQEQDAEQSNAFNQSLRKHLSGIKQDVKQATSLQELSTWIDDKLGSVIGSLDDFQHKLQQRQEQEKQKIRALADNLKEANQTTQKLNQALEDAKKKAHTDCLTDLPNRLAFDERVKEEMRRCQRYARPLSIAMTDIDFFKKVNDTYGHQAGDKVLQILWRVSAAKNL
jgi:diguanylate cyclase